jgi:Fe-S cluster assembly protein SufD
MPELATRPGINEAGYALVLSRSEPDWVRRRRAAAWQAFNDLPWPSQRDEEWMRTDVRGLRLDRFRWDCLESPDSPVASPVTTPSALLVSGVSTAGRATFVDGRVVSVGLEPELLSQGVLFGSLPELLASHADILRPHFQREVIPAGYDRFAALLGAFWTSGSVLYVPRNVVIDRPLHVLKGLSDGAADLSRVMVILEDGAEATLLMEKASVTESASGFHCGAFEIIVGNSANLRLVTLQNWGKGVWNFGHQKAVVGRDSTIQWTVGALGSRLSKVNQHVELVGDGASSQVNGVMFTEDRQHQSLHTLQHHRAPNCRSDFLYKAALQDHSRTVWRGMIKVDPGAHKTDGYQRNDNLMLSTAARADSIPGLEIEADDVRCTHGSTSGRVDEELIFYARSRGFTRQEAVRMVVTGFFQQVFDRITIEPVRDALGRAIARRVREYD